MPILESIFEGLIGEIFNELLWKKILKPFFFYFGVALLMMINLFRKNRIDPYKQANTSAIGLLSFIFLAVLTIILIAQ